MDRFNAAKKASILGLIANIFLCIIKFIIGFISNSQAMIADAFNSASDILSSFMTYIGNKIASKNADEDHNLGHGKAEYIFSMLISLVMIVLSLTILRDSILSFFKHRNYHFSNWLIVVCVTTITIKFFLYLYTKSIGEKHNNLLIKANSKDHRNDCIMTSFNLLSSITSMYGIYIVDSIVGSLISLWILLTGINIFRESFDVLMDKTLNKKTKDKVLKIIKSHKEVVKINHFNATPVGYMYQISFTIFVDGNLSTFESHKIADTIEKEIDEKVPEIYLTVVHVNPIDTKGSK